MIHWLALNKLAFSQTHNFIEFLHNESPSEIFRHRENELVRNYNISHELALKIREGSVLKWAEKELKNCENKKIKIVRLIDKDYPEILKEIQNPPILLYVNGELRDAIGRISIVGARRCTEYGEGVAYDFAKGLANFRISVVSGLAEGIDTEAHKGALDNNGYTIGVLGCGLDIVYPQINEKLFDEISKKGALVSEFPLGSKPNSINFPIRNRIISGLSNGVLIVEAAERSGSLITARFALEQNRNVYAIPGNINWHYSRGTNNLIKKGAKLVDRPEEIVLDIFPQLIDKVSLLEKDPGRADNLSKEEILVFDMIKNEPVGIDSLIEKTKLDVLRIFDIILNLQIEGYIKEVSGKRYIRR